jgi:hypothetical protein
VWLTTLIDFFGGFAMSDSTKAKAEAISAPVFTEAWLTTHSEGGTIAHLAEKLGRSIEQVRAKRNSVAAQLKERGVELPSLQRMARSGHGGAGYDQSADMVAQYLSNQKSQETEEVATSEVEG